MQERTTSGWRTRWLAAAAPFVCAAGLAAQQSDAPPAEAPVAFEEQIVVTATRREEAASRLPASVTVVSAAQIAAAPALAISDVLEREVPGFHLLNPGLGGLHGAPQTRSVSLRGLGGSTGSRTLVLLDGVPLVDPLQGTVDWNRVPMLGIDRVEVVRTATSTAWGNLALGGVIQILTREPGAGGVALDAEAGEQGLARAELSATGRRDRGGWRLSGRMLQTDGYVLIHDDYRGPVDRPRAVEQESVTGAWHFDPRPGLAFQFGADWSSDRRGHEDLLVSDTIQQAGLRASGQWTRASSLWEGRLHGQRMDLPARRGSVNATRTAVSRNSDLYDVPGEVVGGSLQWSRTGARHLLTAGADVSDGWIEVNDEFRFVDGVGATRGRSYGGRSRLSGLFLQESFRPNDRLALHLGARVDDWRLTDGWRNQVDLTTGVETARNDFTDRSRTVASPTLGVVYQAATPVTLRLSLYSGFRAAVLADLYRATRGTLETNPDLEAERLKGAEVGAHFTAGASASLDFAAYWNEVDDPIVNRTIGIAGPGGAVIAPCGAIAAGAICRQKDNLGALRSRGLEAVLAWNPAPRWNLRGNYAWVDSTVTSSPGTPELVGRTIRYVPEHSATVTVGWSDPRWLSILGDVRYASRRYDDDLNLFPIDSFTLVDLRLSRDLGAVTTVYLNARNLLDEEPMVTREIVQAEIGPPRQLSAGVRLRLGRD